MKRYFERKSYKVRPAGERGIELSLPASLKNKGIYKTGDTAQMLFDDSLIIIVPANKEVDLERLVTALDLVGV